jgi:uroporphyrinogen decarboxylase
MTPRHRVLSTFAHEKTDRVTIGYEANAGIHMRLAQALGVPDGDLEKVRRALGVDYRGLGARYKGPPLFPEQPGRRVDRVDGFYTKWVAHKTGGYWDFCDFPLQNAGDEVIAAYPVPNPDDFDYDAAADALAGMGDYAVHLGNAGTADIINSTGRVMGMEDALVNLLTEHEATLAYTDRRLQSQLGVLERLLDRCKDRIDFLWLGEDLGTQHAPMISLGLYRRVLRPRHQKFIDLAEAHGLPVLVHTCGSSSWAYEDFIEMGVTGVDTLQPEATHMSPRYLKDTFGGRLSFRGCVSTAMLAFSTAEEVARQVRETLEIMMPGGGYHFAPTHMIQDNTPVENVLAMYKAARESGVYQ